MPSRNSSAKACEAASLSPNETASLTDFSDIVHASRYAHVFAFAPAPGETGMIAQGPSPVQRPSNKAWRIVSRRPRGGETENGSRKGKYRPPDTGTGRRKKSRRMGGSKF